MKHERAIAAVAVVLTLLVLLNAARLGYLYYTEDDPKAADPVGGPTARATPTDEPLPDASYPTVNPPASPSLDLPDNPRVVFLGDGYTAGEGGDPRMSYATRASRALRWNATVVPGGEGSGFLEAGAAGTLAARLAKARPRSQVDLVVVAAGTADVLSDTGLNGFRAAVTKVLDGVVKAYPKAKVLLVGPFALGSSPPRLAFVNSALSDAAVEQHAAYVSPTNSAWLSTEPKLYVDQDDQLTTGGQARTAVVFERAIASLTDNEQYPAQ